MIDATITALKLLCKNYKAGNIDLITFCTHARVKVLYLNGCINEISNQEKRKTVHDLVTECENISSCLSSKA